MEGSSTIPLHDAVTVHAREQRQRNKKGRRAQARAENPALKVEQAKDMQRRKYTKQYNVACKVMVRTPVDYQFSYFGRPTELTPGTMIQEHDERPIPGRLQHLTLMDGTKE